MVLNSKNIFFVRHVLIFLIIFLMSIGIVSSAKVEQRVLDDINATGSSSVVVILNEDALVKKLPKLNVFSEASLRANVISSKRNLVRSNIQSVLSVLKKDEFNTRFKLETSSSFSGRITQKGLLKLRNNPKVKAILYDKTLTTLLSVSRGVINADQVNALVIGQHNITGEGVGICIVDSGIDYTHPDLGGCFGEGCKVRAGYDFYYDDNDPHDPAGHGTRVAGISAANGTVTGVAPLAHLLALKSMNNNNPASGTDASIAAGIDWCVNNSLQYNISVISISIGDNGQYNSSTCPVSSYMIENSLVSAHDAGIFVSVASGNNGYSAGISYPACSPNVISVGASDNSDNMASFTNTGELLDILAPGVSIVTTQTGGGSLSDSGTSMSAPHVAGATALFIQSRREYGFSDYTPQQVEDIFKNSTSVKISDSGYNFSRLDILSAVQESIFIGGEQIPLYSDYLSFPETTNIMALPNLTDVVSLTLSNDNAKVIWNNKVNIEGSNLNSDVIFGNKFVYVNSSKLDSSMNSSALVTLKGVDCSYDKVIFYSDDAYTYDDIVLEKKVCDFCTDIDCNDGTLSFTVSHFTGFSSFGNANLTINNNGPRYPGESISFYAYYVNSTSGEFITSAECNISFSDNFAQVYPMDELTDRYEFNYTFLTGGTYTYNVTCAQSDFSIITSSDVVGIYSSNSVPEFSSVAMVIAVFGVLFGFYFIREKY